ncbi:MAG: nucleotidyltransferase domain-containing protein [Nitrososphaeria archaeon]|nr:nucleotidyltransferase domain-containing protein [Nitrososphaeria archaeon]
MQLKNLKKISDKKYCELIRQYVEKINDIFKENLLGVLLFGSVARGKAKPLSWAESDIDIIFVVEGLPSLQKRIIEIPKLIVCHNLPSLVQGIYMTPKEFEDNFKSKSGWIIEALADGIILYDPQHLLSGFRKKLLKELKEKGVERTSYGWVWPIKLKSSNRKI